jgi:CheY-like chemotaxis protein
VREDRVILIIEDDEAIRESLKEILQQEGYRVFAARNGSEELAVLNQIPRLCLVLLDLFMPVMSGPEFLSALQKEPSRIKSSLTIVVLSASPPEGSGATAVKPLTQGFIKKPVDLEAFLATVDTLCQREAESSGRTRST